MKTSLLFVALFAGDRMNASIWCARAEGGRKPETT
jgi:hypothetical protein